MKTIHLLFERCLIATFMLCFSTLSLYIPNLFLEIPVAQAGGIMNPQDLKEPVPYSHFLQNAATNISTSLTAVATPITASMTTSQFFLDNVLDGIAWSLAKNILSQMTSSIVNWVNSGFKGSPAFVTDLGKFLEKAADATIGQYLDELGGLGSFICSPFRLDVRVALAVDYDRARAGEAAASCTLSGALSNIESFLDNTKSFVDAGGWDNWFSITSNPTTYTPYGSMLAAKVEGNARLINKKGQEIEILKFADGFLSSKVCQGAASANTSSSSAKQNCKISTPGKVISEALTFQLSTGPQSLISADEINEIVSAIFGQLAQQAITGAAGLLGLSGGTGHTYSGTPVTDSLTNSLLSQDPERLLNMMVEARDHEKDLQNLATLYRPQLDAYANDITRQSIQRLNASDAVDEIDNEIVPAVADNIFILTDLIDRFDQTQYDPPYSGKLKVNPEVLASITQEFNDLDTLYGKISVDGYKREWESILSN